MSDDVMVTAAIDFGTMYSGYSYSFKSNPEEVRVNTKWTDKDINRTANKAPTCLLLKQEPGAEVEFVAFGFEAQEEYKKGVDKDVYFYDEFKMILYCKDEKDKKEPINQKMVESLDKRKKCDATTVFRITLKYLKDKLLDDINSRVENKLEAKNIQWVLTVPAIWSDAAKRFMRTCAKLGGVVDDEDSERLIVSLEPECAAMYCRGIKKDKLKNPPEDFSSFPEKTRYMVVDCGGGTVDITAHDSKDTDNICELFARNSRDWGGRQIDRNFEEMLRRVMGEDVYNTFEQKLSPQFLDLKIKFEESKGSIKFDKDVYTFNLSLTDEFNILCKDVTGKAFDELIKGSGETNVSFSNGFLTFKKNAIDEMFQPVVEKICNHVVYDLLNRHRDKDIEYIFLAGGFSDCRSLQITLNKMIEKESLTNVKILTPEEAVLTIMKGAVQFGYNPQAISSRRSRYTYGTCVHEKYDPKKHDPKHRVIGKDGQLYCSNIFYPLLVKEDTILQDDVLDFVFQPLWNKQEEVEFYLYSMDESPGKDGKVDYVTDRKMKKKKITIKLDTGADYSQKPIRLLLYFGSTELHVQVVDDNDPHKKKGEASLDLLDAE